MPRSIELCQRSLWHRWPARLLYERRIRSGEWYIRLDGTQLQLAAEAIRHVPFSFRRLGRSVPPKVVEGELHPADWQAIKAQLQPGDKIWPFLINPWTMAMRGGYVVVRRGKVVNVSVTVVS